uniref:Uncharacterized protein n=1 Tax=Oryza meridionalis TaxID=40149 RepID=A0A0E0F5S8_9ORYZ
QRRRRERETPSPRPPPSGELGVGTGTTTTLPLLLSFLTPNPRPPPPSRLIRAASIPSRLESNRRLQDFRALAVHPFLNSEDLNLWRAAEN